jgi:tetratricopeptide (TPR) repeat protein
MSAQGISFFASSANPPARARGHRRSLAGIAISAVLVFAANALAQAPADTAIKDPLTLGNAFYEKGEYSRAAEQYLIAARDTTSNIQRSFAWFNLGNCHVQGGAYNKAIVAYRRSIEEAPNFTRAWQLLGDVYYTIGAIGEATVAYRRLLELEETSVHARQMLGESALKGGDVTEALRHFDAALKLDPDIPDIYLAIAEAHARIRDYPAAQKVLEQALLRMSKPTAEGYFYLGQLYELDGNPRKAIRAYEEGLLLAPTRAEYYMRIAGLHERAGDDFLSLLILEQGINAGLQRPDLHLRRGTLFFRQQRYERALEEYRKAYALGSPAGRVGIENVAAAWFNAGKKKEADALIASLRERD